MVQRLSRLLPSPSKPTLIWGTALGVALVVFLVHFYGHVLGSPNSVLMTNSGDGLKNYYTFAWHVEHDDSLLHYGGSGYPFGEHVFFTDGHPLLSWVLQLLPFLAPWKIGILNLTLILGMAACAVVLFALLRRFGLAPWASAAAAFSIMVLQPQVLRLGGHLSLSHCWLFPLTWYALVRTRDTKRWVLWAIVVSILVTVAFLTHPYTGFMAVLFIAGYYGLLLIFHGRTFARTVRTWLEPVIMCAVPLILFFELMNGSDVRMDRPEHPGGADIWGTRFVSLIVASHPPFRTPLTEFFRYDKLEWESFCYLGLSSLLILAVVAAVQVRRWTVRSAPDRRTDELPLYMGSAFLVLLFAMGEWQKILGSTIPMLAQFRGTGRFAWVFFYVCTVFCATRAYGYLFNAGPVRKGVAIAVYVSVIGFYAVEGWAYHIGISKAFGRVPNVLGAVDEQHAGFVEAVRKSGAAAIIPLPFQHVGSECYLRTAPESLLGLAMPIAYHSAIPLMAGLTSRTSLKETRDLLALLAPDGFAKDIAHALPKNAAIVLLRGNDPLDHDEQRLWDRATPLYEDPTGALRSIPASALVKARAEELHERFRTHRGSMLQRGSWWLSAPDASQKEHLLAQTFTAADLGPINGVSNEYKELFFFKPGQLDSSLTYEFSMQFEALDANAVNSNLILEHTLGDGKDGVWEPLRSVRAMPMQVKNGAIVTLRFKSADPDRNYKLLLYERVAANDRYAVSHLLLRPIQVDVWREGVWDGRPTLFLNNVPLAANRVPERRP